MAYHPKIFQFAKQRLPFGDGLARHLGRRVNQAYELLGETPNLKIRGTEDDTRFGKRALQNRYPLAIIARSNLSLLEGVLERMLDGVTAMHFEGGYPGYAFLNARVIGLLYLLQGQPHKIKDPFIAKFRSFEEVRRFAGRIQAIGLCVETDPL